MPVVLVERVQISTIARTLSGAAERQFAEASNLEKELGNVTRRSEVDGELGVLDEAAPCRQTRDFSRERIFARRCGHRFLDLRGQFGAQRHGPGCLSLSSATQQ